jgi:hypothetical protein
MMFETASHCRPPGRQFVSGSSYLTLHSRGQPSSAFASAVASTRVLVLCRGQTRSDGR